MTLRGSRFAAEVQRSRMQLIQASALLVTARTYTRDRDGKFSSDSGGGSDSDVMATKTISSNDGGEVDMSVLRAADGTSRLHVGISADGDLVGESVSLDRAGAAELQQAVVSHVAAARVLQSEVKGLQAEADRLDARISEIDQRSVGARTDRGTHEYVPLSESDRAERARLVRDWEAVDERIGGLEGGDGEEVGRGVIAGHGGDLHHGATVKLPAKWTTVDVSVTRPGETYAGDSSTSFTLPKAEKFADAVGEMVELM